MYNTIKYNYLPNHSADKLNVIIFRFIMEPSVNGPLFEEIQIPVPFGHISG